jgi:hypothetical protein
VRAKRTCGGKIRPAENPDDVRMCPRLATREDGLCDEHRTEYEAKRGTASQRGYDARHRRWRHAAIARAINKPCPLCGDVIVSSDAENGGLEAEHSTPLAQDKTSRADRIVHARCNPRGGAGTR